ncbi:hypothetical protein PGTUg99_035120 [Puccinia graminis f. sp. tritici]|uniref:Uncharacterized protein n=1 Tax=Puccinia graminis f. sp. tritici TaxID=56615 RepID=A0A5B0R991_PUCGR|nr:hypothetical protein PGTUg99_035120 [Puccinia graminis f. sp. tritici]
MALSTSQSILEYTRHHNLTCDPDWTFEFAEDLVIEFSIAFKLAPPTQSLDEDIKHTWSSLDLITSQNGKENYKQLESLDSWLIPQGRLAYAKVVRDLVRRYKHLDLADPDWWGDGLFEPQLTPIMDDYILARRNTKATPISLQPDDLNTIKNWISFDGRQTFTDLFADGEKPIHIPTPEELSETTLQLSSLQYQKMKENKVQRGEVVRDFSPLVSMASDLLESDETLPSETSRHAISPPLIARQSSTSADSWRIKGKDFVSSVISNLREEEIRQFSPTLSNDAWNDIDSCLRPSCTPPSSPSPHESNEQKDVAIEFLSSSADPNNWDKLEGLDNPFETVLFSRTEGMPLHLDRSTSFNPRKHWDMASCLFDEHQPARASITPEPAFEGRSKEGNQDSLEILNQLVANRGWDDQQFEHEIFGSPGEAVNLHSGLKRIPIDEPDSPIMKHEISEELLPSNLDEFRLREPCSIRSKNTTTISRDLQKVEGLKALNIELPWNAYSFLPSTTLENLTDLDSKPVDDVSTDDGSSSKDGYSFISKRLKSEHPHRDADEPWIKLSDFIDPSSSSENESYCSQLDLDGKNESGEVHKGAVSTPESTKRSTSPTIRTDQDFGKVGSPTESSQVPNHSSQSNPSNTDCYPRGFEVQSDFGTQNGNSDCTEDDEFIDLLGLRSVDSSADIQNHGFYGVWTMSEQSNM